MHAQIARFRAARYRQVNGVGRILPSRRVHDVAFGRKSRAAHQAFAESDALELRLSAMQRTVAQEESSYEQYSRSDNRSRRPDPLSSRSRPERR
jgi:hypothetical protein